MEAFKKVLQKYYLAFVLLLVFLLFTFASPYFFAVQNLTNILVQNAYVIVATIGIAMIMISGGADLSVSFQMGLVSVLVGKSMSVYGLPVIPAILLGIAAGAFLGFINGYFTVKLKVNTMVTTLATMTIYQGAAFILSESKTFFNLPADFKAIGQNYIGLAPICVIIMVAMVIIAYIILNKTYFGRHIFALGGNEEAARLAGINIHAVRILAFVVAGVFVGVATLLVTARTDSASANISVDAVFTCFTACVLGGISFRGGSGSVFGVVFGVLILGVLSNGMQLLGLSIYYQYIVKGIILMGAIAFDNYQKSIKIKKIKTPASAKA